MGQAANLFDATSVPRLPMAPSRMYPGAPAGARLIPGAANMVFAAAKKKSQSVMRDGSRASHPAELASAASKGVSWFLPQCFKQFHPARLGTSLLDGSAISLSFLLVSSIPNLPIGKSLHLAVLIFFLAIFLLLALQEGLYGRVRVGVTEQCTIALKAILWATLIIGAAQECASTPGMLPLILMGGVSAAVLCATRWVLHQVFAGTVNDQRNVLLIGGTSVPRGGTPVLQNDLRSDRSVKGFLPEGVFRGLHGAAALRNLAREQCIDEVIIATHDCEVAEAAIREARRNQLDVRIVPNLFGSEPQAWELEGIAGTPLVKIHEQPLPEWTLAVKRIADAMLSSIALATLSPLLLIVAAIVLLDSPGPIFYRALRVGRKRREFTCYKFRTMIPGADAAKEELRSRNEREGAFFKIENDPRLTRAGSLLRRYSLDELPQLWNVLRGEMSLVGPRPHPPDDVERYSTEHLQRLDFVPGITGLWQVTARRDRSFERSVALDVEYIQRWSLGLDLQILWKTIPAVFQGSGA